MNKNRKYKKNKKSCTALFFIATAIITTAGVVITIREGRRIKAENELLSYEVW
jgi:hypothetical protein